MTTSRSTRVQGSAMLRALAHPLRTRLLGALRLEGPATASDLARRLGESSGSTSYHLRQLARFGYVEEAADQPSRRERVWRASAPSTSWSASEFLGDDDSRAALESLDRLRVERLVDGLQGWYDGRASWPAGWVDAAEESDAMLRLRAEDLDALGAELWAVVDRWADRQRPADDVESRWVRVHVIAVPDPEEQP